MKANTNNTDILFDKTLADYPFNSEKNWCQVGLTKAFSFRYIHFFFKKSDEVLVLCISAGSNLMY